MNPMDAMTRRDAIKLASTSLAALSVTGPGPEYAFAQAKTKPAGDPWKGLKVGLTTYVFQRMSVDDAVKATVRVGVKYVCIKNAKGHLPVESATEQRQAVAQKFRDAGMTLMSCGNLDMKTEADVRPCFEYARDLGVPTIVCTPDLKLLPLLDKTVKAFNIKLAIHNHGPGAVYPSPYDVWKAIASYDSRIGLCIDVGHTARAGVDPVESILKCKERLYDLHIKDIDSTAKEGRPVEVGRGVLDIKAICRAAIKIKFPHLFSFEYEKDLGDPLAGLAESVGYVKGVLAGMSD